MNAARNIPEGKKSQRGASMPLALLLFLICAMAASIVLAASTVAVGRSSDLVEGDKAYYNVSSAVNVFRHELLGANGQGHAVTVAVNASGTGSAKTYKVLVSTDGQAAGSDYTILECAAIKLLFGSDARNNNAAQTAAQSYFARNSWSDWPKFNGSSLSASGLQAVGPLDTFNLTHTAAGISDGQQQGISLEADVAITDNGSLAFTFKKPGAQGSYSAYASLVCEVNIEVGEMDQADAAGQSETKYATVTWLPPDAEQG